MAQWWEHSPPTWPGFKSRRRRHMLVVSLLLQATPVFPSPQKPTFPNSSSTRNQADQEPLRGCATSKSLFTYSFKFCNSVHSQFIRRFSFLSVLAYNLWGEKGVKFCVTNVPIHFLYEVFTL